MELLKYRIFLSIAECGSYTKVCDKFGYTQSGISKMMNSMENEIGFPLIIRSNKGISLTEEGQRLLPRVKRLIEDDEILEEEYSAIRGVEKGRVRLGSFPTISYTWIPDVMKKFHQTFPGIQVDVIEENSPHILEQWLSEGFIDLKVTSIRSNSRFEQYFIAEDPFVVLMPESYRFSAFEKVPFSCLKNEKFVFFRSHEGDDPDTYEWKKQLQAEKEPVFTTNSDFTCIRMVENNGFVTILPELIARTAAEKYKVIYRPLDIKVVRNLGFEVRDKNRLSPSVKKFIKCALTVPCK